MKRIERLMYRPQVEFCLTKEGALDLAADLIKQAMELERPTQHVKLWFNGSELTSFVVDVGEAAGL